MSESPRREVISTDYSGIGISLRQNWSMVLKISHQVAVDAQVLVPP
jgi:hypothetical protein